MFRNIFKNIISAIRKNENKTTTAAEDMKYVRLPGLHRPTNLSKL